MRPDRAEPAGVMALLRSVQRRLALLHVAVAVAVAAVVLVVIGTALKNLWHAGFLASYGAATAIAVPLGLALFVMRRPARSLAAAAVAVERARPDCRNVVVTAEEISRHPGRTSSWMAACVTEHATTAVRGLRAADVIPAARTVAICAACSLVVAGGLVNVPGSQGTVAGIAASLVRNAVDDLRGRPSPLIVTVRPPAYASADARTLLDPERLEVLEGSRLTISARGDDVRRVRFGTQALGSISSRTTVDFIARESGYFALEDADGGRSLIALSVTRDRLPQVRVEQPARDLLLPDASRTIPLKITASDDLGLDMLELRYTKVSGTGEQFEFQEGTLPLRLERTSGREWRGEAQMALPALALEPGDSLVYRAVARDARPREAGLAASDTYFIEIAGPGQIALDGVEMPPDEERYALSQQMVVLKIERLRAREANLPRQQIVDESAGIAAEQRAVRANFVFLLGGHVEDEEVEAEQSSEISEGRLQNTARRDVNAAIREMTRAEQGLVAASTGAALPPAKAAVEALQRAFGRSRYLLRALAARSRIDPSRRLTGPLTAAGSWRRDLIDALPRDGDAERAIFADLTAVNPETVSRPALDHLAERALAIDPSSPLWQDVAQRLLQVRDERDVRRRRARLNGVLARIHPESLRGLIPRTDLREAASPLRRAWEGGRR